MIGVEHEPSIVLAPDLASSLVIQQYSKRPLRFHCYSLTKRRIELWTSLSPGATWTAIPFVQQNPSSNHYEEYSLQLNTCHLSPGHYEYTLRYSTEPESSDNHDAPSWTWYVSGIVNLCCNESRSTWLTPVTGTTHFQDRNANEKCQLLLYQDAERGDIHLWMPVCQYADCYLSFGEEGGSVKFHRTPEKDAHLLIVSTAKKRHFTQLVKMALDYYEANIKQAVSGTDGALLDTDAVLLDKLGYCTWNAFGQDVDLTLVKSALDSLREHNIPVAYLMLDDGWQSITEKRQLAGFEACTRKFPDGLSKTLSQLKSEYAFLKHIGVWHALWGYWDGVDQSFAADNQYKWSLDNHQVGIIDDPKAFYDDFYTFLSNSGVDYVKVDNQGSFQELISINDQQKITLWDSYRRAMIDSSDRFLSGRVLHCMALTPHVLLDPILSSKQKSIFRQVVALKKSRPPSYDESHSWHIYANAINALWTAYYPVIGDWDMFQSDHPFAEYHASSRALSGGPIYITDIPGKHNVDLIYKLIAQTKHAGYTILRSSQAPKPTFETVFNNTMATQSLIALYNVHQELPCANQGPKELVARPHYGVCGFWNTGPHEKLAIVSSDLFCNKKLAMVPTVAYAVSGPDRGKIVLLEPSCDHQNDDDNGSIKSVSSNSSNSSGSSSSMISGTDRGSTIPIWKQSHSTSMMARVSGYGSTLVSVSTVQCAGLLSMACLGLLDKFNGTVCIVYTSMVQYQAQQQQPSCPWYATFEAHLSHKSESCGFWVKTHDSLKKRNSRMVSVGLVPGRVRVDGYALDATHWTWCASTGLLTVDMLAAPPPLSEPRMTTKCNGEGFFNDAFRVQVDICKA
ncbi:glycoside hydrolase family 36 protein [Mucor lusitanicus CBS 277.49]|uniref:Glycoside hydrolase family 36 protein n=1 Tax=Mucor lusitanicus CBS 277.49 TaxID=747725 RepID=A0A162R7Y5_MUCCL|nr:glycoside hydrolase family 36 protein [Mucor lusitanicus CBS 277.49]